MNTNPYFTHCISDSLKVPNAPKKSKEARNMLYDHFTPPGIKLAICKVLNFTSSEKEDKL
jgi:hypothetical protein